MEDVQATLNRFLRAFSTFKLEEMVSFFSDDATAFFPIEHQSMRLIGKEAICEAFSLVLAKMRASGATRMRLDAEDIFVQSCDNTSIVTFHIRDVSLSRRTLVLRRVQGRWRIEHMHASNAPPTPRPPEART